MSPTRSCCHIFHQVMRIIYETFVFVLTASKSTPSFEMVLPKFLALLRSASYRISLDTLDDFKDFQGDQHYFLCAPQYAQSPLIQNRRALCNFLNDDLSLWAVPLLMMVFLLEDGTDSKDSPIIW